MTAQASLFGGASYTAARPEVCGQARKKQGMAKAAAHHASELAIAKRIAVELCQTFPTITIEDVRNRYEKWHLCWDLGNAAGSVFKGRKWECVGRRVAHRPQAQGREIKVWRLKRG